MIRTQPNSRRLVVSAWNPTDLPRMALPPCHFAFQCYVEKGFLHLHLHLRSNDLFLGAPFNIASYALLLSILAALCHLQPGRLIYTIGDAHLYMNHLDQVRMQLSRPCRPFPRLHLSLPPHIQYPDQMTSEMISLHDYTPHSSLHGTMAV